MRSVRAQQAASWQVTFMLTDILHPPQRRQVHTELRNQGIHRGLATPLWLCLGRRNLRVRGRCPLGSERREPSHPTTSVCSGSPETVTWAVSPKSQHNLWQAITVLWCTLTAEGAKEGVRTLQQTRERSWEKSLAPDREGESRLTYSSSISHTEKLRLRESKKYWPKETESQQPS